MTANSAAVKEAVDNGVINLIDHGTLLQDIDGYAETANIPVSMVLTSMKTVCKKSEIDYVTRMRRQPTAGLLYLGAESTTARMMAIAGACLRNFIDARVVMLSDVIKGFKDGTTPDPTVILVPNFCVAASDRGVADWETTHLLGWLYDRDLAEKKTFLYVSDMLHVEARMGALVAQHLKERYQIIK